MEEKPKALLKIYGSSCCKKVLFPISVLGATDSKSRLAMEQLINWSYLVWFYGERRSAA
jgi:hypothetical protein